jgi:hypothetical protein
MREAERQDVKFSRAQVERANQVWGTARKPVIPGMTEQEILYNAGIAAVLAWMEDNLGSIIPMRPRDVM